MRTKCTFRIVLWLAAFAQLAAAQEVVFHPDSTQSLSRRWEWAKTQASQTRFGKGYWIGYSIKRLMGENSTIGSMHIRNGKVQRGPDKSLSELIYGVDMPLQVSRSAEAKPERKMVKDVGLFFLFNSRSGAAAEIKESTFELSVDFEGFSLLWLGPASDESSLDLLARLYREMGSNKMKEEVLSAVGLHGQSVRRRALLAEVLASDETAQVREQAAFWLGQSDDPEALRVLQQTAKSDRALEVRKQAVFAMSQMHLPEVEEALFELARNEAEREVCKEAIFWLAQMGSARAASFLKETIEKTTDTGIQKHAVFALTQLPDEQGVPILLDIAEKHRNAAVRKEALFWLAQTAAERAVPVLKEAIAHDDDWEIQKQAVFALTQLPDDEGVPVLIEIAETHKTPAVRKEAIFWLGQSDDPRATAALLKLVRGQ